MRSAAILLVVLAATIASCATRHGEGGRAVPGQLDQAAVHPNQNAMSSTVIGLGNPLLAEGAQALEAGDATAGVRLTLEGLKQPSPVHDLAAGHANLCAGYVLLQRYDEALTECDLSISLDRNNWRAYNNRAAVFAAQGLYELAVRDIEAGLKIAPDSAVLLKSLSIVHRNQELLRHHRRFAGNA